MRRVAFILAIVLLAGAASQKVNPKDPATLGRITLMGFQPLQSESKVLVVDVRSQMQFDEGHIPGAINIPLPETEKRIDEVKAKAEGRPIVTYCSCPAEHSAAEAGLILYTHGVRDVRALIGGYPEWVRSGGKIEK